MNDLVEALDAGFLVGDGAMGTYLAQADPTRSDGPVETLALTRPDRVEAAHVAYLNAGSQVIQTHSFGLNPVRLRRAGLARESERALSAAARAARRAVEAAGRPAYILGSLGPPGMRGDALADREAVARVFQEQAEVLAASGVDGFIVETLSDPREWHASVLGVRRASDLPLLTTVSLSAEGVSRDGYELSDFMAALLEHWDMRPSAFGLGCGAGPAPLASHLRRLRQGLASRGLSLPLIVEPNAGLPSLREGRVVYGAPPAYFGQSAARWLAAGASLLGACCGTTPDHVAALSRAVEQLLRAPLSQAGEDGVPHGPAPWEDGQAKGESLPPARTEAQAPIPGPARPGVPEAFWISLEVDPPKGAEAGRMLEQARLARDAGADAVNVADSPMARVRMGSLAAAAMIEREAHMPTLLHFTTRDRNLMGMQADLLGAHALGLRSVLALTGDPPGLGDYAQATAVYDLDAVGLIRLVRRLNQGEDALGKPLAGRTAFHLSAGVDPGAPDLAATVRRTREKIAAGAERLLTQPLYEPETLVRFLDALFDQEGAACRVQVILGVMPLLSARQADYLHHEVPGVRIPDVVREIMRRSGDQGERVGIELAQELVERVRPYIAGVYIVPSLGRMRGPLALIRHWQPFRQEAGARRLSGPRASLS